MFHICMEIEGEKIALTFVYLYILEEWFIMIQLYMSGVVLFIMMLDNARNSFCRCVRTIWQWLHVLALERVGKNQLPSDTNETSSGAHYLIEYSPSKNFHAESSQLLLDFWYMYMLFHDFFFDSSGVRGPFS